MGCCGQHLCEGCVHGVQAGSKLCPMCGVAFQSLLDLGFERLTLELEVSCVFKDSGCEWTGYLRGLDGHVTQNCLYVPVKCPWECGESVAKCLLEKHKLAQCPKRPWYMCFDDANLRRLAQRVDTLSQEKQTLSTEMVGLKERLERSEEEKGALNNEINELRGAYSTDIQELRLTITSLKTQVDELKNSLSKTTSSTSIASSTTSRKSSSASLSSPGTSKPTAEESQQSLGASPLAEPSVPIAPTTLTVTEVKRRTKQRVEWYSPFFLSHSQGYQLQLRVDCGGVLDGKDSHLSVYVYLTKGEYDKSLKWPFEGSVTVRLLDQVGSLHHEKVVEFPKGTSQEIVGCVKEGVRAKRGQGFAQFLPLVDLKPYLSENTLNFEVQVSVVRTGLFAGLGIFRKT